MAEIEYNKIVCELVKQLEQLIMAPLPITKDSATGKRVVDVNALAMRNKQWWTLRNKIYGLRVQYNADYDFSLS